MFGPTSVSPKETPLPPSHCSLSGVMRGERSWKSVSSESRCHPDLHYNFFSCVFPEGGNRLQDISPNSHRRTKSAPKKNHICRKRRSQCGKCGFPCDRNGCGRHREVAAGEAPIPGGILKAFAFLKTAFKESSFEQILLQASLPSPPPALQSIGFSTILMAVAHIASRPRSLRCTVVSRVRMACFLQLNMFVCLFAGRGRESSEQAQWGRGQTGAEVGGQVVWTWAQGHFLLCHPERELSPGR